ncbi:MAG: sulfotransferase [Candidatus Heimdallarchaeaceae archaeon]
MIKVPPILVTGMARSGTSMATGILHYCGAWGGMLSGPTRYNAKGMFENSDIRNKVIKPYLRSLGVDPMGQNPLPNIDNLKPLDILRNRIHQIIDAQGYQEGIWYYKGAKTCLIWPIWAKAFPEAKWIIVRRREEDVISSCMNTGFMRAYKSKDGWKKWTKAHLNRFDEIKANVTNVKEVWPSKMVAGDFSEFKETIEWAGLTWNEPAVRAFIAPELWHYK